MRAKSLISPFLVAVAATGACSAEMYRNAGPDMQADPPRDILLRVVAVDDATAPESVAVDGVMLCHAFDPGRRRLPECPKFDAEAEDTKFEIETYVSVGEHRVSVQGWGVEYIIKSDTVFLPGTEVLCQFDYGKMDCIGHSSSDVLVELEEMGAEAAAQMGPPDLDAPSTEEDSPEEEPSDEAPAEETAAEEATE